MIAGLLKERITIITPVLVRNNYGEEETQWVNKYTTRARLIHKSGNRTVSNSEITYDYSKTLQIRDYVPIDDYDRILWDGNKYRIMDIELNREGMYKQINIELINE